MLTQKDKESLAKLAGIPVGDLTKAISDEKEVDLGVVQPYKVFKTATDLENDDHVDRLRKLKYDDGVEVGEKRAVKSMVEVTGIDYEGKNPKDFVEKLKSKVIEDAKIPADKKVRELQEDLEALKKTHQAELSTKEQLINNLSTEKKKLSTGLELFKKVPSELNGISRNHAITLIQTEYQFEVDESGETIVKDSAGKILKNEDRSNKTYDQVVSEWLTTNKYTNAGGPGRGGDDEGGSGGAPIDVKSIKNSKQLTAFLEKQNISEMSEKGIEIAAQAMANEGFETN